ncbi:MAG: redoxin family protein [Planctomycetota bacterium]
MSHSIVRGVLAVGLLAISGLAIGQPASAPATPAPATKAPPATTPVETKPAIAKPPEAAKVVSPYVLGFKMKDIDGKEQDLAQYKGKVIMIVNVASQCGNTPQYDNLEKLYQEKKDKGFVILAFPANNFREQEPGTDSEIKAFCTSGKYHITFPLFSKVSVTDKDKDQCDLYKTIASQPKPIGGNPEWNFQKFLVDRNGNVVSRFDPKTDPMNAAVTRKIDELLAAKAGDAKPADATKPADAPKPTPKPSDKPADKK